MRKNSENALASLRLEIRKNNPDSSILEQLLHEVFKNELYLKDGYIDAVEFSEKELAPFVYLTIYYV